MNEGTQSYEGQVADAARTFADAEAAAKEARAQLNASVARAREAGIPVATLLGMTGWKQPKSIRDAILAHRKAVGS
jgi:hypothetical protein